MTKGFVRHEVWNATATRVGRTQSNGPWLWLVTLISFPSAWKPWIFCAAFQDSINEGFLVGKYAIGDARTRRFFFLLTLRAPGGLFAMSTDTHGYAILLQ